VRSEVVCIHDAPVLSPRLRAIAGQVFLEEVEDVVLCIRTRAGGRDADPRAVPATADVFAQTELKLACLALDACLNMNSQ
jgi:hypothetical protein